jgi:acetyl esterase/lipase
LVARRSSSADVPHRLISPWASLRTPPAEENAAADFVDPRALQHFAHLYSGAQRVARMPGVLSFLRALLPRASAAAASLDPPIVVQEHERRCEEDAMLSPLDAADDVRWERALEGVRGVMVCYGAREVLAPQAVRLTERLRAVAAGGKQGQRRLGTRVEERVWAMCHAAPVVWAFLGRDEEERARGVKEVAQFVGEVCSSK